MENEAIGEFVDIDSLIPHPDNPRINNHAVEEVAGSNGQNVKKGDRKP